MSSVNKAILIGNLGADPELRYTASQASVCSFSIATTERRKGKDGNALEYTTWHRIVVWNRQAEACSQYLRKGSPVYVEGRITTRSWDDKKTGQKRYTTEIVAERVQFLGGKRQDAGQRQKDEGFGQGNTREPDLPDTDFLDDVPF